MSFTEKYLNIFHLVENYIDKIDLLKNINLKKLLERSLFDILKAPSKHIRALVSFLYLKANNIQIDDEQIEYQTAIELVHNASLIHDDVIDESEIRRNTKTLNSLFNSKLAVITGDYLLAVAMKKVLKFNDSKLIEMFTETLEVMSIGEIDQYFDKFEIPLIQEYIRKSEQKTAKLFETALCGALMIAGKNIVQAKIFAKNFGIAFQIRDDLINCKTSKSDINEGIYTAPVIFAKNKNIDSDAIEKTNILLNNYITDAKNAISHIEDNRYKFALIELLDLLRDE